MAKKKAKEGPRPKPVEVKFGELDLALLWNNRAQFRLGESKVDVDRLVEGETLSMEMVTVMFKAASAMNIDPTSRKYSGEDLFAYLEEVFADGGQEAVDAANRALFEGIQKAFAAGKKAPGKSQKSSSNPGLSAA